MASPFTFRSPPAKQTALRHVIQRRWSQISQDPSRGGNVAVETTLRMTEGEMPPEVPEKISCPLVITRDHDAEILLDRRGGGMRLPRVEVPRWQRLAPHIRAIVRSEWGIEVVCRFVQSDRDDESDLGGIACLVLES